MTRTIALVAALFLIGLLAFMPPAHATDYTLIVLSDPSAVTGATLAYGINNSGQVTGSYNDNTNIPHGFVYSGGVFTNFAYLLWQSFVYSGGSFADFEDPSALPQIGHGTQAHGINNNAQLTGVDEDSNGYHGFVKTCNVFTSFDAPVYSISPSGINDSGQISRSYYDATGAHGFFKDSGGFHTLNYPSAYGAWVTGINNNGIDLTGYHGFEASPVPDGNMGGWQIAALIASLFFILQIVWLYTKLWFWLSAIFLCVLASFIAMAACVVNFQIFEAVGFFILTYVLWFLLQLVIERIEQ